MRLAPCFAGFELDLARLTLGFCVFYVPTLGMIVCMLAQYEFYIRQARAEMNLVERLIASPMGIVIAQPWFDRTTLAFFERWFFPMSRMWAAARAARGSVDAFHREVPIGKAPGNEKRVLAVLNLFESRRRKAAQAEAAWDTCFFGSKPCSEAELVHAEGSRLKARVAYNSMRRHFWFLKRKDMARVSFDIQSPVELASAYARLHRRPSEQFGLPAVMPHVEVSRKLPVSTGVDYWIRFASPSQVMNDMVYARVHEPVGVDDPPTLIFLHGVCVEFDHWKGMISDSAELVRNGIRVVRLEAPWHGRRVPDGRYGGEKFIGTMPLGTLNFFSAQIREAGVAIDWVRSFSQSRVGVGGSSLGAHVARLVATRCSAWPERLHPDALFIITPCGRLEDAAVRGAFAQIWKNVEAAANAGWSSELRSKWMNLIDPTDLPEIDPENIVAVVGRHDRVTPADSGLELLDKLKLPKGNRFVLNQGHFSTPLRLLRDKRPARRLQEILCGR